MRRLVLHVLWGCAFVLGACQPPSATNDGVSGRKIQPKWQISLATTGTTLGVAAVTPGVAIVDGVGRLIGLDPATGTQKWSLPIPFGIPYAGVVVLSESLAALVTGDGFLTFDPRDGREMRRWVEPNPRRNPSGTSPQMLADGRIIYVSRGRDLLALNASTGRLDTLAKLPGDTARNAYVSSLAVFRDTIYAPVASDAARGAAFKNTVPYRYSLRTGVLDSLRPDRSDSASLARWMLPLEKLLVASTDYSEPSWLGFDRGTGDRVWKVPAAAGSLGPSSQVAVVGDTMFAGGNDGLGYVIHLPTGRLIRTLSIPNGLVAGVVACGGDVFINVIGQLTGFTRDGKSRIVVAGLVEGKDAFIGAFSVGAGIAVIGNGAGLWTAFPCDPPN
jgi:outer membrane protein assembly factor BamB